MSELLISTTRKKRTKKLEFTDDMLNEYEKLRLGGYSRNIAFSLIGINGWFMYNMKLHKDPRIIDIDKRCVRSRVHEFKGMAK